MTWALLVDSAIHLWMWLSTPLRNNRSGQIQRRKSTFEALPGVMGEQGNNVIYFRGTGETKSKNEGNRGTNVILGSSEYTKLRFWFWGTRENAEIFQGNKGRGIDLCRMLTGQLASEEQQTGSINLISWKLKVSVGFKSSMTRVNNTHYTI